MNCWEILGIEPTSDERAIRRAYAKLLKSTRPDDDAAAYQNLRQAFDDALAVAPYVSDDEEDEAFDDVFSDGSEDLFMPSENEAENAKREAVRSLEWDESLDGEAQIEVWTRQLAREQNMPDDQARSLAEEFWNSWRSFCEWRNGAAEGGFSDGLPSESTELDGILAEQQKLFDQGGSAALLAAWPQTREDLASLPLDAGGEAAARFAVFAAARDMAFVPLVSVWAEYFGWRDTGNWGAYMPVEAQVRWSERVYLCARYPNADVLIADLEQRSQCEDDLIGTLFRFWKDEASELEFPYEEESLLRDYLEGETEHRDFYPSALIKLWRERLQRPMPSENGSAAPDTAQSLLARIRLIGEAGGDGAVWHRSAALVGRIAALDEAEQDEIWQKLGENWQDGSFAAKYILDAWRRSDYQTPVQRNGGKGAWPLGADDVMSLVEQRYRAGMSIGLERDNGEILELFSRVSLDESSDLALLALYFLYENNIVSELLWGSWAEYFGWLEDHRIGTEFFDRVDAAEYGRIRQRMRLYRLLHARDDDDSGAYPLTRDLLARSDAGGGRLKNALRAFVLSPYLRGELDEKESAYLSANSKNWAAAERAAFAREKLLPLLLFVALFPMNLSGIASFVIANFIFCSVMLLAVSLSRALINELPERLIFGSGFQTARTWLVLAVFLPVLFPAWAQSDAFLWTAGILMMASWARFSDHYPDNGRGLFAWLVQNWVLFPLFAAVMEGASAGEDYSGWEYMAFYAGGVVWLNGCLDAANRYLAYVQALRGRIFGRFAGWFDTVLGILFFPVTAAVFLLLLPVWFYRHLQQGRTVLVAEAVLLALMAQTWLPEEWGAVRYLLLWPAMAAALLAQDVLYRLFAPEQQAGTRL